MKTLGIILSIAQVVVSIFIIIAVLFQSSRRSGLSGAISGGSETFFSRNKSHSLDSVLSNATGIAMAVLVVITLLLNTTLFA